MTDLLYKEWRLAASPLSFAFIAAALFTFVPGYPILMSAFFTTLGIFYSFQTTRENNDVLYSVLLPVAKSDTVRSKFLFTASVELCSFALSAAFTLIRMTFLSDAAVYTANALMGANLPFLGFSLFLYGLFNRVFLGDFFKTACYYGKPFILYAILSLLFTFMAEAVHFIPGLEAVNCLGFEHIGLQLALLLIGTALFIVLTLSGLSKSLRRFEKIDL